MFALREAHENGSSTGKQFELKLQHGLSWFELSVSPKISESDEKPHFIVLSRDITDRKQAEQKISQLAYYDSLTRLPNRQSFMERLDREVRLPSVRASNSPSCSWIWMDSKPSTTPWDTIPAI